MRHREKQLREFPCSNANVKDSTASIIVCDNDLVTIPREYSFESLERRVDFGETREQLTAEMWH